MSLATLLETLLFRVVSTGAGCNGFGILADADGEIDPSWGGKIIAAAVAQLIGGTQHGSATAPASGTQTTSVVVTLPTPYAALKFFCVAPILAEGVDTNTTPSLPTWSTSGWTPGEAAESVTVHFFNSAEGDSIGSEDYIQQPIPFAWKAEGDL